MLSIVGVTRCDLDSNSMSREILLAYRSTYVQQARPLAIRVEPNVFQFPEVSGRQVPQIMNHS